MADSIVTRLQCIYEEDGCDQCTFCLAKAEIERLRAEAWALAQDLAFMTAEVDKFAGENYEQYCEIKRLRAERDDVEALHQRKLIVYRPNDDHDVICNECDKPWPCRTHVLLHPEESRRG